MASKHEELPKCVECCAVVNPYVNASCVAGGNDGSQDFGPGAAPCLPQYGSRDGCAVIVVCCLTKLVSAAVGVVAGLGWLVVDCVGHGVTQSGVAWFVGTVLGGSAIIGEVEDEFLDVFLFKCLVSVLMACLTCVSRAGCACCR